MAKKQIKLVSWNVNGLRAVWKKGFLETFAAIDADVFAIQETKLQQHQLTSQMKEIEGYESFWSHASTKKGYSGVGTYTRIPAGDTRDGIGVSRFDDEGRILETDFGEFVFFNVYFPNGQMGEERLQFKLDFYEAFFNRADQLRSEGRSLIITGDYNTATPLLPACGHWYIFLN